MRRTSIMVLTQNDVERILGGTIYDSQPDIWENNDEMILDGDLAIVLPENLDVRSERPMLTSPCTVGPCRNNFKFLHGEYGIGDFHLTLATMLFVCSLTLGWIVAGAAELTAAELSTHRVFTPAPSLSGGEAPVVTAVALDSSSRLAATAGDDHLVRLWNVDSGKLARELHGHTGWVRAVAFAPQGTSLASAGDDCLIKLWNVESGEIIHTLDGNDHPIFCLTYRPDGLVLMASGFDGNLSLFDTQTGKRLRKLACPEADVRALAISPDGRLLAAAGRNGHIRLWSLTDYKHLRDIEAHRLRVRSISFSPNSRHLASGGDDRRLCIWDADTGAEVSTLMNKSGRIRSVVFCGDDVLAAGTTDNAIRLWDLASSSERLQLVGHTGSIAALAYHPGSRSLLSGSFDTTARIWKLPEAPPTEIVTQTNK
jgi:WD40 repeat protein